jgi:hypothetical protein
MLCSCLEVQWQERGIQVVQCSFFFSSGPSSEWWGNIGRAVVGESSQRSLPLHYSHLFITNSFSFNQTSGA